MMTTADHDLRAGPGPVVASADACDLDDRQVAPAPLWRQLLSLVLVVLLALPSPAALAGLVIPQVPMLGSAATPAVPNLMVLLDNSSSMLMEVMPAQDNSAPWGIGDGDTYKHAGQYSHLCNSLYFNNGNPSTYWADADSGAYPLPPAPDSTSPPLAQPSFNAAPVDGFAAYLANPSNPSEKGWKPSYSSYGLNTTNWSQSPQPVVAYDPARTTDLSTDGAVSLLMTPRGYGSTPLPAGEYAWVPDVAGTLPGLWDCLAPFEVNTTSGGQISVSPARTGYLPTGSWIFYRMTATMAAAPSYARWYSYYRSRMNTMKSALGNTFASTLSGGLRTGLLTTTTTPITASNIARPCPTCTDVAYENRYNPVGSYAFMPPATLDATGRAALLAKIYGQVVPQGSFTNLHTALSRAGQYYAGLGGAYGGSTWTYGMLDASGKPDPVQSSCQRNYSLLVTDGLYSDAGNGQGLRDSLAKSSYDSPPGRSGFSPSGGSDGRSGKWTQPFPDPQAYKPFDDTNTTSDTDCWPGYNEPVGQDQAQIMQNNLGIQTGAGSASYQAYLLNADGTESTLPSPLLVPRDADHVVGAYQFWNNGVYEYYVGGTETNNQGVVAVGRWAQGYVPISITSTLAPGTPTCPGGICNALFNYRAYVSGGQTNCPTGEQAGSCTTTGGTTSYWGEAGCQLAPWAQTGTSFPANTNIQQIGSKYFYKTGWPQPNMTCAGTRLDLQFVCTQSPVTTDPATYFYFRVPGLTHDASGAPIKYTWSRSAGRVTTPVISTKGVTSSLADIAMYYYDTDIRPSMPDNLPVPAAGASPLSDTNRFQHMTTYTMGLGVSGYLKYAPDYAINPTSSSDWSTLVNGTQFWPDWQKPPLNYGANDPRVDDLWHAAVNGRGRYYSASNVSDVVQGLMSMVSSVVSVPVYGGAVAADRVQQQANGASFTNFFTAYWPTLWVGDLLVQAATIDASTSTPITTTGTAVSASASLRNRIQYDKSSGLWCDDRNMLLMSGSSVFDLRWDTPVKSGNACVAGAGGTQLPASSGSINLKTALDTTTSDKGYLGSSAGDLVNWLRGSRAKEISAPMQAGQIFRYRVDNNANFMPLGDIVGGQPVYVGPPVFNYTENDYGTFKSTNANRAPRLYAAANDGFVHAFDPSTSGSVAEKWAMMPSSVVPEVYQVASPAYATNHKFILDGAPVAADVHDSGAGKWRTILVGGSRGGGALSGTSGFYAIDITDPSAAKPIPLWEFRRNPSDAACSGQTDVSNPAAGVYEACQLGFAYSTPVITKLTNGRWVVLLASGYNNRDGKGHLYILDAVTGAQVARLDNNWNGQDSGSAPESGLAQVNVWIGNSTVDNTALLAYGGDLNGNVWRYDLRTPASAETMRPTLLARLVDGNGVAQPVTTLPEMYFSPTNMPLVSLGTGQLFSDADRTTTQVQSIYGLIDAYPQSNTMPGALARSDLVGLQVSGTTVVANTNTASVKGYVLDLPGVVSGGTAAERLLVNPVVIGGNLVLVSNAPSNDPCVAGGSSWIYVLNVQTGLPAAGAGQPARTALPISAVGTTVYVVGATPVVQVTGANDSFSSPLTANIQPFVGRRAAWREMR